MAIIGGRAFFGTTSEFLIALIVLWTVAMFFWRAAQIGNALYASPSLPVFCHLPISDANIFKIQSRLFVRVSLWSALDFSLLYWALIAKSGMGYQALFAGIGFGIVHWLFVVASALVLFAYALNRFVPALGWLLSAATVCFAIFGEKQLHLTHWLAATADWIPPVGWILRGIGVVPNSGVVGDFLPALIGATTLCLAPLAYRKIQQNYSLAYETLEPQPVESSSEEKEFAQKATDHIQSREFLQPFNWSTAGFVERLVTRVLTSREKTIAEFLIGGIPNWTKLLRNFVVIWMAILLGILLFAGQLRSSNGWLIYAALFLAWILFTNLIGSWSGFAGSSGFGLQSPIVAHYPISFREFATVMLKVNFVRFLLYVPVIVAMSLLAGMIIGKFSIVVSLLTTYGLKFLFIFLCAQPVMIIAPMSPSTNDTQKLRFAMMAVIAILLLLGSGAGFFFAKDWKWIFLSGFLSAGISIGGLLFYARRFNRSRFDLVPLAKNEATPQ